MTGHDPRFPWFGYLFFSVISRVTVYDALLDGPIGTDGPTQDRRTFGAEGQAGLLLRIGDFELFYRHMILTREIEQVPQEAVKVQMLGQVILSALWD
ncbi:MAG: lipid A deacylase LpxR family protein [Deltaproteobacteria bacterium]|nr:lipid A deacylase LpxR family protein [Deltaproteobacteria bacterium]